MRCSREESLSQRVSLAKRLLQGVSLVRSLSQKTGVARSLLQGIPHKEESLARSLCDEVLMRSLSSHGGMANTALGELGDLRGRN